MSIFDQMWKTEAVNWTFERIDETGAFDGLRHEAIKADERYVNIFLKSMRIVNSRQGWSKFYPVVHSFITVPHRAGGLAEIAVVSSPSRLLELDSTHIDRVTTINQRLFGPIPYRGGDLGVEVGLFAVKSADFVKPFLSLLEVMATAAGVSFVSVAKPFVEPLKKGLELLTGSTDLTLQIGLATAFKSPETGYFVSMRAPAGTFAAKDFVLKDNFELHDTNGKPITQYPYLVLGFEASEQREDWFLIPSIVAVYESLQDAIRRGKQTEAEEIFGVFKRTALTSPDLLIGDAVRLVEKVNAETSRVMPFTLTAMKECVLPDLKSIALYH